MGNSFCWVVALLGWVMLSEAAIPVANGLEALPSQSSTMMAPCEKETGIAYWRCVRVAALKMPAIGSAVRTAVFKTAAKPVFACPGNHASVLELILDKTAPAKITKSTGKLFVNPPGSTSRKFLIRTQST